MQKPGSLKDTQGILRHASVKTTGDIYVQLIDASVRRSVNLCPAAVLDRWQGSVEDRSTGRNIMRPSNSFPRVAGESDISRCLRHRDSPRH
jgi:hypothetical protein